MIAKENYYYNADRSKIVGVESAEQAFLAFPKGSEIPADVVKKYGLGEKPKRKRKPASRKKAPANKSKSAKETK